MAATEHVYHKVELNDLPGSNAGAWLWGLR